MESVLIVVLKLKNAFLIIKNNIHPKKQDYENSKNNYCRSCRYRQ